MTTYYKELHHQYSLDGAPRKTHLLKKQVSEEVNTRWDIPKIRQQVKVAWMERSHSIEQNPVEIVAKKCGQPKPIVTKPPRSPLVPDLNTLLISRQELNDRLRKSWQKNRRSQKPNLDIYLNHVPKRDETPSILSSIDDISRAVTPTTAIERVNNLSRSTTPAINESNNLQRSNSFLRVPSSPQGRKIFLSNENLAGSAQNDDDNSVNKLDNRLVIVMTPTVPKEDESYSLNDINDQQFMCLSSIEQDEPPKIIENLVVTENPIKLTAQERRLQFRNSSKRAFSSSISITPTPPETPKNEKTKTTNKPILQRMLSAPVKRPSQPTITLNKKPVLKSSGSIDLITKPQEVVKYNLQDKRNVKSAPPRRKLKGCRRRLKSYGSKDDSTDDEKDANTSSKSITTIINKKDEKKSLRRPKIGPNSELVTMISLVSPAESELEEPEVATGPLTIPPTPLLDPPKINDHVNLNNAANHPIIIRPSKAVTFKHTNPELSSSGVAYWNSFPSRRGNLTLASSTSIVTGGAQLQTNPTPQIVIKRKQTHIIRTKSILREEPEKIQDNLPIKKLETNIDDSKEIKNDSEKNNISIIDEAKKFEREQCGKSTSDSPDLKEAREGNISFEEKPQFANQKEKECWDLFTKVTEGGVAVTFDTILRGMLTPTEYRLRKISLEKKS